MFRSSAFKTSVCAIFLSLAPLCALPAWADPAPASVEAPKPAEPKPQTIGDPSIDVDDLKLLLEPMAKAELEVEANGWFGLLRAKVKEISEAELAVRHKNRELAALKEVKKAAVQAAAVSAKNESGAGGAGQTEDEKQAAAKLAEANAKLTQTVEAAKPAEPAKQEAQKEAAKSANAKTAGARPAGAKPAAPAPTAPASDKDILKKAQESAEKSGDAAAVTEKADAARKAAEAAKDIATLAPPPPAQPATAKKEAAEPAPAPTTQAEAIAAKTEKAAEAKTDVKVQLVDYSTKLATERTAIIDRLKIVLDQIDKLGGDSKAMRAYISAVSGLKVEVSDYESTIARLKAWLKSDEGGLRWTKNIGLFVTYLVGAYMLSKIVRGVVGKSIGKAAATSKLLRNFIVDMSGRAIMAVGVLAGLSALEIDLAPLLAVIGAAGFVVAFALQGTLSNLASGLLIMFNKPFDIGDAVEVGSGIKGRVEDVTIFSTLIQTEENTRKIVPNNTIWNGVIVNNSTGATHEAPAT
jgi:small conductance mechanosensitive channel